MAEHFALGAHGEEHGECEFVFVGAERADTVAEMFGQHRHHAVYEVDTCGAVLRLAVDDGVGVYVVCDVGDVYAHFIVAVVELAQRQGVVEVFCVARVDGESGHIAHVAALGHNFVGNAGADFISGFLYRFGIAVGQTVLGHDSVDFGVVLAGRTEHVDNFALRVLGVVGPCGDTHHCLVAGLAAAEFGLGDVDVCGKELGVGEKVGEMFVYFQCADKGLVFALDDIDNLCLGLGAFDTCGDCHLYLVAVESVHGVALGNEDFLGAVVGDHAVFTVRPAHEYSGSLGGALG